MEMIKIEHVSKTFEVKGTPVHALKDINMTIDAGDIFGIIGMSGAGKSTLIRCLNFLEKPSTGNIIVNGKDLSSLTEKELRKTRTRISMIFQHFNLLMQKSILDNVCFPLEIAGMKKNEATSKAMELLEIVGLTEKAKVYPSQLSGGQKQRVAIARALASDPEILLCDEATSALDPQTTKSILSLLKEINQKFGITVVLITHEMSVVEEICSHVAILSGGELVETGTVHELFASPKSEEGKKLIYGSDTQAPFEEGNRCIRIVFTENSSFEPVIANMILQFKTPVNIMKADTRNIDGIAKGEMVLQMPEDRELMEKMIVYLLNHNLTVEEFRSVKEVEGC
ncbi:MAG: ATP-binding cassette domain-containing protein [Lachnospiraceae bacterium]